ncbi:MAG TPA: TIGR04255 family protein [Dongiaceae bacterium]|nr:TIGR04255 family protein [Dongiaceae bacterium]
MARRREHLRNAPIVEAVIDFRVLRRQTVPTDRFANLQSLIGKQYSQSALMQSVEAQLTFSQEKVPSSSAVTAPIGWRYQADSLVAQFRVDGFTFSKLEPYTTWNEVFSEALRLWGVYVRVAEPAEVVRVAVRYINRLQIPVPAQIGDYLEAPPELPSPISQQLRQFLSRFVIDDVRRNASAVIIQASEPMIGPPAMALLIDIDAFKDNLAVIPADPGLRDMFLELRDLKNEIFFASITERAAEMYE